MRKVLPFTTAVLILVLLYTAWLFYSRWSAAREVKRREAQKQAEDARKVLNTLGGERLAILSLTINPPVVHPGEPATLCYGVSNAKAVRIEPPVEDVWPSYSRCVQVTAREDTTFKLIAEDATGHTETASVPLQVR